MQALQSLPIPLQTVLLLTLSNVFMTFAWYGHLKNLATAPWYVAALISWGIALFEYLLQVPANRIDHQPGWARCTSCFAAAEGPAPVMSRSRRAVGAGAVMRVSQ